MAAETNAASWRVILPTVLSLARLPFALAYWWLDPIGRLVMIGAAAASDLLDGLVARWLDARTRWGGVLDSVTDKVFVVVVLVNTVVEGRLAVWRAALLLVREGVVVAEAAWLIVTRRTDLRLAQHGVSGKLATGLVLVYLAVQLFWPPSNVVLRVVYWLAVAASVVAAIDYARRWPRGQQRADKAGPRTCLSRVDREGSEQ